MSDYCVKRRVVLYNWNYKCTMQLCHPGDAAGWQTMALFDEHGTRLTSNTFVAKIGFACGTSTFDRDGADD